MRNIGLILLVATIGCSRPARDSITAIDTGATVAAAAPEMLGLWRADAEATRNNPLNSKINEETLHNTSWLFAIQIKQGCWFRGDSVMEDFGGPGALKHQLIYDCRVIDRSGDQVLIRQEVIHDFTEEELIEPFEPFDRHWLIVDEDTLAMQLDDDGVWLVYKRVEHLP